MQETKEIQVQSLGQKNLLKNAEPTPVFLPGKFHGQEPGRLQSMGSQELDITEAIWHLARSRSQFSLVAQSCPTLCQPMHCSRPGFPVLTNSWSLLKLMSIQSVMPSNHIILCFPLLLLRSVLPIIRIFPNESVLHIGGRSIEVSASAAVFPMNIQDWFPLENQTVGLKWLST